MELLWPLTCTPMPVSNSLHPCELISSPRWTLVGCHWFPIWHKQKFVHLSPENSLMPGVQQVVLILKMSLGFSTKKILF